MKIIKCENGHFFDHDAYEKCPLCGAAATNRAAKAEQERKKIFGNPKRMVSSEGNVPSRRLAEDEQTVALPRGNFPGNADRKDPEPVKAAPAAPAPAPMPAAAPASETQTSEPAPQAAEQQPDTGLSEAIRQISSLDEEKTLSYFSAASSKAKSAEPAAAQPAAPALTSGQSATPAAAVAAPAFGTQASQPAPKSAVSGYQPQQSSPEDPVVGWLIGIAGPHLCDALPIFVGINSLGRNATNKIVLSKDPAVSREKHAFITFEPKSRMFYVQRGDSSGLTYLNGQFVFDAKALQRKDIIELGQSRFYFLPLCGEDFSWDEYLNQ